MSDHDDARPAAVPYLAVRGSRDAIDWYGTVFGAVVEGDPQVGDDGSIGHAVLDAAVRAGADPDERGVYVGHGSRNAWFVDPFGHRWGISSPEA